MDALLITHDIHIPSSEFEFSYARSSGPGGQNVNKVNSKALLRWNILKSSSLSIGVRARLLSLLRSQLTAEGEIVISSDCFRDQIRNREDCLKKLRSLILSVAEPPKARKKTRPSWSSVRKTKEGKSRHSEKKNLRRYRGD